MSRRVFYTTTEIKEHKPDYAVIIGGRNLGKSYAVKNNEGLAYAWQQKKPTFLVLRREDQDCKPSRIESYFNDSPVETITGGEYNTITARGGNIYFANTDPTTGKTTAGIQCGYYVALKLAHHIKSGAFPFVRDIIFEEFCPEFGGNYLDNEPTRLQSLASTLLRSRKGVVWLIGNTVSRINPYNKEWKLNARQKIGTILDYYHDTIDADGKPCKVKISVQRCESVGAANGMFFGRAAEMINKGDFTCNEHPRLERQLCDYTVIYEVLLVNDGFNFVLQLLSNDDTGQLLLYAYPHTGKRDIERVLCKDYDENPMHSVWFDKSREIEQKYIDLLNAQQVAFSDNLTGDECITTLKALKSSTL